MSFYIQSVEIGGPRPFYLLGPCSLECESFVWEMARSIKSIAENLDIPLIFKASYDKANRTSITSFRGPGVREGCRILSETRPDGLVIPPEMEKGHHRALSEPAINYWPFHERIE